MMNQQYENQLKFDTLLSTLSTDFNNIHGDNFEKTIHFWMEKIALTLDAEIAVLFRREDNRDLYISDFWRKETITEPVIYNPAEAFPYLTSAVLRGELIEASSYNDLPEDAKTDRQNLQKMGTSSFLFFPIGTKENILGSFLFAYKTKIVSWDTIFIKKLRFIIQIFSSILKKEQDKKQLEERVQYESLLANLSRDFVSIKPSEISDKITYWLHKAAETLGSNRALVFKLDRNNKFYISTAWKSEEGKDIVPYDPEILFPWMNDQLRNSKAIIIPDISAFPKEASVDRKNMSVIGAVSVLVLPIIVEDELLGALAFSSTTPQFKLTTELVQRFQIISQTFASAILRYKIETKFAEERERLSVTLESIGDGVITTDIFGKITLLNNIAEKLTAWKLEDAKGKSISEIFHIIDERTRGIQECPVDKVLKTKKIVTILNHTLLIGKNGKKTPIADSAAPIKDSEGNILGVILVFRDVTLEKQREADILKLKKLDSVGVLAGGIAHDFNNILTGILGNINLAEICKSEPEEVSRYLNNAAKGCKRAASLTQKLLTFSKGGTPVKENASIGEIVKESIEFTIHGSKVKAECSIPEDLWTSEVDIDQINQVIQNLTLNSIESMTDGGIFTVICKNKTFYTNHPHKGEYIEIKIKDTGSGISNENIDKIIDPYFTTKETGSGLGLAITYSIIHKHDGFIEVQSIKGEGTEFTLYLPANKNTILVTKPEGKQNNLTIQEKYSILILDDEDMIRNLLKLSLEKMGHNVVSSSNGKETIEKYKNENFDLIILDITIPGGLGGVETIKELKNINPNVKAIVSSGYTSSPVISDYKSYGFSGTLTKPYLIDELKTIIDEVMTTLKD
ncbi:MAG: response regulator [Spirochaetia bacterium]|jgi:PAS domain S-box-containing protein|nr:response regulator [Spirochaetia bacterium]